MFWERFLALCAKSNESPSAVCKKIGLSNATATKWRQGAMPGDLSIKKVADYFKISPKYFTEEEDSAASFLPDTMSLPPQGLCPVYGAVSAGYGVLAQEDVIGYETVDARYSDGEYFYLKVRGNSMSPKIEDGDLVLVKRQDSLDDGDIGVLVIDGTEGLIKTVLLGAAQITLRSQNPQYPPRVFSGSECERVRFIGKVVELKRFL